MALNIKKSSLQRIYEYALKGIRKQGRFGFHAGSNSCVYQTADGACCAVGLMLTPEQRSLAMSTGVGSVNGIEKSISFFEPIVGGLEDRYAAARWYPGSDFDRPLPKKDHKWALLQALQKAHDAAAIKDGADKLDAFELNMQKVAAQFDLRYTEPGVAMRT